MSEDTHTRQGRRKTKQTENKDKPSRGAILKKLLIAFSVFFVTVVIAGGLTAYSMIKNAPPLDPDKLTLALNPEIYDQNDELFTTLNASENRRLATIKEIPELLEDAFISVEDIRFRDHSGIDIRRIGGAIIANITGGFGAEGASTITQQVVKNLFLSSDKKITRKVQEQYLALKLEQIYSKDQILEMYLNAIFFSEGAWGVVEASDRYFSKTLDELNVEDAAMLAGIPQRPNFYNPFKNPEDAQKRRDIVITLMERHGRITSKEASDAKAVAVTDQLKRSDKEPYPYRAFLDQVLNEVEALEGISANDIYTGGLKIYTTLDQEAQTFADQILQTDELINYPDELFQAGFTVIDTKTGAIKAIGGGRQDDNVKRGFSWATDPTRQPGSTIKPILDYGPAIEHLKWSTYHQLTDEPHQYKSTGKSIRNFNDKYSGDVSIRYALQKSLNIPAVKAFQAAGIENATKFGKGLGIPLDTIEESYSLGGFTTGFSTLELAGAYAAFGNEGTYQKPHAVRKIVFPNEKTINLTPEPFVAMSDYTAFMVTDILKSAVSYDGTGNRARVDGLPMAGKTGTSNFSDDEKKRYNIGNGAKDIWFSGYSSNYTIAVWTGYNTPEDGYLKYDGNSEHIAKYIFKHMMTEISKEKTTADFTQPSSVVKVGVEKGSGLLPSKYTPKSEIVYEYFVKGTEPTKASVLYMKPPTPSDFMGAYDEESDQIMLSWSYPDEEKKKNAFELQFSINDSAFEVISSLEEMQHIIFNPEKDATYRFKLHAVSISNDELKSDIVEIKLKIPAKAVEENEDEPIPDPLDELEESEEPEEPEEPEEQDEQDEQEEPVEPEEPIDEVDQDRGTIIAPTD